MSEQILFNEDKAYKEQEEEASYMEKVNTTLKFLKYTPEVSCCQNCRSYEDGVCSVMKDYNGPAFDTYSMGKCRHYAKKAVKEE